MNGLLAAKENGERKWMYPSIRKGVYYKWRSWLSYVYLVLFFSGPFIRINGQPMLMLNVIDRQFVLLGQVFWPQDIFIFMIASLVFVVCIVLFTIAFGRIFCGLICPQTIFMEMVFRKIEIWIEGNANQRKKLDAGPWDNNKIWKKVLKHFLFIIISFLIANTFLAYIIGSESLVKIIVEPVNLHWVGFFSIWVFTIVFYLVYSQVRELVCTVICPYGRLQGVLTDEHTLVVAYNDVRGEPRGKLDKTGLLQKGDCVDCSLCVAVCPTGIDIRKGTQMECTNCTACIDACDEVMDKINKPRNLIGYFSEDMIRAKKKPTFNIRMAGYSGVILILLVVLSYFIFSRKDMDITVMRGAGMLYQEQPNGYISNIYNADITNKANSSRSVTLKPEDPDVKIKYIQAPGVVAKGSDVKTVFFVFIPANKLQSLKTDVRLQLISGNKIIQTVTTTFVGPVNN
ncbi:cytochrome c oxidase accessory protein FixG [Mucilaginibacter frigoritolerans]|uniref:Cytochrome c oxidase accessory protein FixG n=1 Tax=Mucilaginibacter frigoritolerans TaxID=652788 RepID=A0A562U762_9SPHI|nr:cytochrome c oxidase accessory protein CcoG [Mucilaginibacter frigoritolerans]TWJ01662.1 cytochrome c oxidase accessory protein FixG [Mucilaginibacter frigoritolerans]